MTPYNAAIADALAVLHALLGALRAEPLSGELRDMQLGREAALRAAVARIERLLRDEGAALDPLWERALGDVEF